MARGRNRTYVVRTAGVSRWCRRKPRRCHAAVHGRCRRGRARREASSSPWRRNACATRGPRPGLPAGFGYTRLDDRTIRVSVAANGAIPADGVAAVLTVTGVNFGTDNWLSVYPAGGASPGTSNVNFTPSDSAVANLVTVKLGVGGAVDILSYQRCDVIVDVAGVYRPTSVPVAAGRFQAVESIRALDTRSGGKPGAGAIRSTSISTASCPPMPSRSWPTSPPSTPMRRDTCRRLPLGSPVPDTSNLNLGVGQTLSRRRDHEARNRQCRPRDSACSRTKAPTCWSTSPAT